MPTFYYDMRAKRKAHPKECASNYERAFKSELLIASNFDNRNLFQSSTVV